MELAGAIRAGEISSVAAVESSLERIAALDQDLKAFVTVDADGALAEARSRDARRSRSQDLPCLHGIPIAVKDVTRTAGMRTTMGSAIFADMVPATDDEAVRRLRDAGAVIVGKTNTPEFAFGAACTNRLQGPTATPWNLALTSGGSSGGSAAAVAAGIIPIAQGTDFGGSVRTPASFCGCVGLRPTPGLIAEPSRSLAWNTLATQGVLARSVDDAALMLEAMRGSHRLDPTSLCSARDDANTPLRVAASQTMGGAFRTDSLVKAEFSKAINAASATFGRIDEATPDLIGASAAFKTLRAAVSWRANSELVEKHEADLSDSFVWNVRRGSAITADEYLRAEEVRSNSYRNFVRFFENYDLLMLPAASVLPFPHEQGEVHEVDGEPCETIIDYLACTYLISFVGFPAIVLPAGLTDDGIPFGVQIVAQPYGEATLLAAAKMLEASGFQHRWPPICDR